MVRIFTFSLLLAAFNSMAFAGFISVDVHKVDGVYRKTGPHSEAPEVDYDCELLVIKADTTYNSARIVVKNKFEQVLYDGILDIKKQPQVLYVPDSDKRSIEIYCGKDVYWGVFEED